ncbi:MAG: rhomboid family intramembrane serine protease [Cyanobacteria bacterium]|nr:rhomboid family intramembrane serine protease [Cyanobacteriota bacterium]
MIPLRDENPSETTPFVTIVIVVLNCLVFFFEAVLNQYDLEEFMQVFALTPVNLLSEPGPATITTVFTSMFLHAGWMHLIGNMWIYWIFGDNIENHLGHWKYAFFYLICGVVSGLTQVFASPESSIPQVGASGAIAGVLGAYVILYPHAKILTLVPIFYRIIHVPAIFYLGIWFATQFFSGYLSLGAQTDETGGVAWWAHIGGFVAGVILIKLLPGNPTKRRREPDPYERYY